MAELKPCPFCGAAAEVGDVLAYRDKGKAIRCTKCFARSMFVFVDRPKVNLFTNEVDESTRYTEDQAAQKAAEKWNRRAESEELAFTRQFIHEHGLEFALASAWNRREEDGK